MSRWRLLLVAFGILLALLQLFRAFHGARSTFITNDGDWYYAYLPSLYFDRDLDLSNQMEAWRRMADQPPLGLARGRPTPTSFTVGPALLWMPAFAVADAAVVAARAAGARWPRNGYSLPYQLAAAWATLVYGLIGAWLALKAALRWLGDEPRCRRGAALAVAAALCATPVLYYLFFEPTMAHGLGVFAASLLVWLWLGGREARGWRRWFWLGAAGGLCALIRPQDSVLLVLPLSIVASGPPAETSARAAGLRVAALVAGAVLVFLPQSLVWQATFGRPLALPQGPEFLQWTRPALLQVWFSPHHGLFAWTPIWLAGLGGLAIAPAHLRRSAAAMGAAFLLESYVNAIARDWWGGDAFGARRFLSLFPVFALGMSVAASGLWPRRAVAVATVAFWLIVVNLAQMAGYVSGHIPHG
jgi:hypothetical protein